MRTLFRITFLAGMLVLASCGKSVEDPAGGGNEAPPATDSATGKPDRSPATLARGKEVYAAQCAKCHGDAGKGDGTGRGMSFPQPRDFTKKQFKYVSSESRQPTEDDLFKITSKGIPGTQMTEFEKTVSERDRWAAVYHVQELAGLKSPVEAMPIPPRPAWNNDQKKAGMKKYLAVCAKCHGAQGKGDGTGGDGLKDAAGNPSKPRNLVDEPFGGGDSPDDVFLRIKVGMAGTPMEPPDSYPKLTDAEVWSLVGYLEELRKQK